MNSRMSEIDKPSAADELAAGADELAAGADELAAGAKPTSSEAQQSTGIAVEQVSPKNSREQKEINGPRGLEPTRYGDWESKGRCRDF